MDKFGSGGAVERIDWRAPELVTHPIFAADRAQALGISRTDVAQTMALASDGVQTGVLRERDRLIPIVIRTPRSEQIPGAEVTDQPIYAPTAQRYDSLSQVVDGFDVRTRDTLIQRRNRVPTISVQAFTVPDVLPPQAFADVRGAIEAMELPPGYRFEWATELESASTAQASLGRQMPLAFRSMFLITLLLFGKLQQALVIWTVVPMAVTGVGLGLLYTGLPFSFTALLGLLSLSGMLIKNAIVLVKEIDDQVDALGGLSRTAFYEIVERIFRDVIDEAAPQPDPWFVSALDHALGAGIPLALVSGADRQTTLRVLAALFGRRISRETSPGSARALAPGQRRILPPQLRVR